MSRMMLNNLKARNGIDRKALGRGIGSGCGKTSSYGHKGGKARSGRGTVSWFEGGQMPIYRRLPKRGFVSKRDRTGTAILNVCDLQRLYENGVLAQGQLVALEELKNAGVLRKNTAMFRLLAKGNLDARLVVSANYASPAAVKSVEAAGGKVLIV
ncbi:MAG: 50S ribosomal protein L15 [Holosporaceae bacterium]|nr:50S ribosomal protein L15 [Holosporaceae bacterium]